MKGVSGKETPYKQEDFRRLIHHHINVCSNVLYNNRWASRCYYYFDMFGGPGIIQENGKTIKGSPVIFAETIKQYSLPYQARIVEQDDVNFASLSAAIHDSHIDIRQGDSSIVYREFLPDSPKGDRYGLLYLDPDMSEDGFDLSFEIATDFARYYPKLDILFYVSANNIKRISGAKNTPSLTERLKPIRKNNCIIRALTDKFQYTFLILTNYSKPFQWSSRKFYDVNTRQGRAIFEKADLTKDELKKKYQLPLIEHTENTCSTHDSEQLGRKLLKERAASVKYAAGEESQRYIT